MIRLASILGLFCFIGLSGAVSTGILAPLHGAIESSIPDSYIVVYHDDHTPELIRQDIQASSHKNDVKYMYEDALKGYLANLNEEQLAEVRSNPRVKFVEREQEVHLAGVCTRPAPVARGSWGLSRISERSINPNYLNYTYPSTGGQDIIVFVVDTGIYVEHSDFGGRAKDGWKYDASWGWGDQQGHGTHVASTAIGAVYGAAKRARAISVKVFDSASGSVGAILGGLDYVVRAVRLVGRPSVINLSLTAGGSSQAVNAAVNTIYASGGVVVAAAGNSDQDACGVSPASASLSGSTITVASSNQDMYARQDKRSDFSNYGRCVSLFAPGHDIVAAAHDRGPNGIAQKSGTSMASPLVAGIAALFMSEYPTLSAAQIKDVVLNTAIEVPNMRMDCEPFDPPGCFSGTVKRMAFNGCAAN